MQFDSYLCFFRNTCKVMSNFNLCFICQENTWKALICLLDNPVISKRETSYGDFLAISAQLKAVGGTRHPQLVLPELQILHRNRAKWHKSWRQLYRKTGLDRARSRLASHTTETPVRAKRSKPSHEYRFNLDCIFLWWGNRSLRPLIHENMLKWWY